MPRSLTSGEQYCELFHAFFDAIDSDSDDEISMKELAVFFQAIGANPDDAPLCFDEIDEDKDGRLSRSEFLKFGVQCAKATDENSKGHFLFGMRF